MPDEKEKEKTKRGKKDGCHGFDWKALKIEWLQSDEILNHFRIRKGITNSGSFYENVRRDKWREAKERVYEKALERAEDKSVKAIADEWDGQRRLWKAVEGAAARILRKMQAAENDGGINAQELAQLSVALERALKNRKLIEGQALPSGHGSTGGGDVNYTTIVNILAMLDKKDPSVVIPEAVIDTEAAQGPETGQEGA